GGAARNKQDARRNASKSAAQPKADEQATLARITANAEQSPASPAGEPRARVMPQPPPLLWKPYIENVPMDHLSQGRALLQFGYFGEAIAELSLAATVGPDLVEANNLLGQAYDKMGAHAQAREHYERALSLAPQNPWLRHNLGYSFFLDDQYETALKHLKQALSGAPTDVRIANSVGLAQFRLHKFDDALKTFTRLEGEYAARLKLADMLERAGWDGEAVKHYEAALRLQPNSTVALERLADLHQRAGRRDQAEALRRALKNMSHAGGG
ncbi:MAG TPA: tetratricopeptide repeat protein, partial [Pyrinomonadaceae bacterium]|nr:tetratricopeptide repeat protein [Pyrinomonadaceae bacterium]